MPSKYPSCVLLCAVMAFASAGASHAAQPIEGQDAAFDAIIRSTLERDQSVGAVVAVAADDGSQFLASYGTADIESSAPMPVDAIFGIGSITKQFTAAAILQLRDAGKLSLDDAMTRWLPDFETGGHHVTLRRLLDHTSGIHDFTQTARFRDLVRSASVGRDGIYELINGHPPQFPPGTAQVYNNAAYWLLHRVIEKASGMPYREYIERELLSPLGLRDMGFCLGEPHVPRRAAGHHVRNGRARRTPLNVEAWYLGSGALCSSARDLVAWLRALHGGDVLSPASYAQMVAPAVLADGTRTRYGMGLQVGPSTLGPDSIGHSGEIMGYGARANWYPQARMAVVVLVNNSGDVSASALAQALASEVLPATPPPTAPFAGDAAALAGVYAGPARGGDLVAVVADSAEGLAVSLDGGAPRPLAWVGARQFLLGPARVAFTGAADGGQAAQLRFDPGNGHYVLDRLSGPHAALAKAQLLVHRHVPLVLFGTGGLALLLAWRRVRRRSRPSSLSRRNDP